MYIIDHTFFTREISIPLSTEMNSKSLAEITSFIDEKVRFILRDKALGYTLFKAFDAQVTSGVLNEDADQKWKDLVDGKEYTQDGTLVKWQGLKFTEGTFKGSLLAHFVYCEWLQWQTSLMSGVGEVKPQAKNAVSANSTQRYVTQWNRFVELYQGNICHSPNVYSRNGVIVTDYFSEGHPVSLLQFLQDNESDYPDAACIGFEFKNQLGF